MGGRSFDVRNARLPECVERMAAEPPACFDARIWRLFLVDCHRSTLNAPAERASLMRGVRPDYCSDCPRDHRESMRAQGRCQPPTLEPVLRDMAEDLEAERADALAAELG